MKNVTTLRKNTRTVWLCRAFLSAIPCVLVGAVWEVRQLQQPMVVFYGPQDVEARILFQRLDKEANLHPYATEISVNWSKPWPKESGLDLMFSERLEWDRRKGTFTYGIGNYGWTYSHVERQGIKLLANANLPSHSVTLPPSVDSGLHRLGWTLTEHYLP